MGARDREFEFDVGRDQTDLSVIGAEELMRSRGTWFATHATNRFIRHKFILAAFPSRNAHGARRAAGKTQSSGRVQFHEAWGLAWEVLLERARAIDAKKARGEIDAPAKVFVVWATGPHAVGSMIVRWMREHGWENSREQARLLGGLSGGRGRAWRPWMTGMSQDSWAEVQDDRRRSREPALTIEDVRATLMLGNEIVARRCANLAAVLIDVSQQDEDGKVVWSRVAERVRRCK